MANQIAFDLTPSTRVTFDSFVTDEFSQPIVDRLRRARWDFPVLLIVGPESSGKTHLGLAWQASAKGKVEFLDDANTLSEETLFIALNRALNGEMDRLLLASSITSDTWPIELPDLRSRLNNIPVVTLDYPGDEALEDIIRSLFETKGRAVKADLVDYLLRHEERSVPAMRQLVENLETAARAQNKDLTKHFASQFIRTQA